MREAHPGPYFLATATTIAAVLPNLVLHRPPVYVPPDSRVRAAAVRALEERVVGPAGLRTGSRPAASQKNGKGEQPKKFPHRRPP